MSGVTLNQVIKKFGETQVIHGVDLDIKDGELCVFVGPSGCGKSTLLRMIAGIEQTSAGTITIGDRDVTMADPKDEWRAQGRCARKGVGSGENPKAYGLSGPPS
jgi:lactose/L-arabinose transport system ATP-binding protein